MKVVRTTILTAALIAIAVPSLTSSAQAWRGWRGGGWGWRGAALGAAVVGSAIAARNYYGYGYGTGYSYPAYGYGYGTGYGHPAYGYGYGTGYYGGYGHAYHPVARHIYARAVGVRRHWR